MAKTEPYWTEMHVFIGNVSFIGFLKNNVKYQFLEFDQSYGFVCPVFASFIRYPLLSSAV